MAGELFRHRTVPTLHPLIRASDSQAWQINFWQASFVAIEGHTLLVNGAATTLRSSAGACLSLAATHPPATR